MAHQRDQLIYRLEPRHRQAVQQLQLWQGGTMQGESLQGDEQPFCVLALTGGGYRGLYTARVLEELEQRAGKPIGQCFDLIAGTSIGGILAIAVAFEIPMHEVVAAFKAYGDEIFPTTPKWAGVFTSKYRTEPLRKIIESILPTGGTIGDALHPLAIPALNLTTGRQQVFKTRHSPELTRDFKYLVKDVALATAAAPIYFPIVEFDNQLFADGGLFANAPDLIALHEANKFFGQPDSAVSMLSVGSLSSTYSVPASVKRSRGVLGWLKPPQFPLLQTILAAQQQFSIQIVAHRLGERHTRIDSIPTDAAMRDVGLDKPGVNAKQTLLGLATKNVTDIVGTELVQRFLKHSASDWLKKEM